MEAERREQICEDRSALPFESDKDERERIGEETSAHQVRSTSPPGTNGTHFLRLRIDHMLSSPRGRTYIANSRRRLRSSRKSGRHVAKLDQSGG